MSWEEVTLVSAASMDIYNYKEPVLGRRKKPSSNNYRRVVATYSEA